MNVPYNALWYMAKKVYVKLLNNKNTKDIDRLVRLSEEIISANILVEKEMKEALKQSRQEKWLKAQELMKEIFEYLNGSLKSVIFVPIHK